SRLAITLLATGLVACGGGGGGDTCIGCPAEVDSGIPAASNMSISVDPGTVNSDNSDSAEIQVVVLSSSNAAIAGQTVTFTAERGILNFSSAETDESGVATVQFRAGNLEFVNRTAEVTIRSGGVTKQVSILVAGSKLTVSSPSSSQLVAGSGVGAPSSVELTFTARAAGDTAVSGQRVRFTSEGSGGVTLSTDEAVTAADGTAKVTVTAASSGSVTVIGQWLDGGAEVTASASQEFAVQSAGDVFGLKSPTATPTAATIGGSVEYKVFVPATIADTAGNVKDVAEVSFAATLGTWENGGATHEKDYAASVFSEDGKLIVANTLAVGASAGSANVSIRALAGDGSVLATTNSQVSVTSDQPHSISLQASSTSIPVSTATTPSTTVLTATVRDANNNVVGGKDVLFKLVGDTGTGATISPVVARTNATTAGGALGQATATFTAGLLPTDQGFEVQAEVLGTSPLVAESLPVTVGGVAGSVAIGVATVIDSVNDDTAYSLPVTVQVTDSSGARLAGARVSLTAWPVGYARGVRDTENKCAAVFTESGGAPEFTTIDNRFRVNEDVNENLILDPGEDTDGPGRAPDTKLTPSAASAGAVPASVTTDENGLATFEYIYLKNYADWLMTRLRATVLVQGTETSSEYISILRHAVDDEEPCVLPHSPFN
ncbi:MAG: Ig-like domain-containing protein, partial [Rhodocyclaceae bacterium]|nr:Ig-like domain-containing protein [Rhodocyclaceae bacterium]